MSRDDGYRVLVDRLWPRGIKKEESGVALWLKEIAPSAGLRKWFSHDPKKWDAFLKKYEAELVHQESYLNKLHQLKNEKRVITFLYSAKNETFNNAVALKYLLDRSGD